MYFIICINQKYSLFILLVLIRTWQLFLRNRGKILFIHSIKRNRELVSDPVIKK